ncbi:MAG: hypothetical protein KA164_10540 [Rhodoferax sp.]|nr:hypothetical protein [Rhodoferax sp.]
MTLLLAALESQALTLGRMRGAALIGQGLDVTIQVQTDPGEGPSSLCFEAEVFHADARQDPSRVQVNAEPTQAPQTVNVRIQSSIVVDEPVVTIYLRAGCTQKTSRRYVMLADIVSEPLAPVVVQAPQAPQVPLVATPAGATGAAPTSTAQAVPDSTRAAAPRGSAGARSPVPARPARAAAPRKPAPVKAVAPPPAAQTSEKLVAGRAAGQSRLKLDPLEVLSERVATLESSTASAPAEQAAREARDAQRLQALEASVKNLLAVATRNEANLADLRTRLQQAEEDRYANPLVYVLVALLVACLAGIAFLLTRRGGTGGPAGNWWSGTTHAQNTVSAADIPTSGARRSGFTPVSAPAPLSAPDSLPPAEPARQQQAPLAKAPSKTAPVTQVDVSLVEMSESTFDRLMQSGTTHSAVRKPSPSTDRGQPGSAPPLRLLNTDDLFDIRQQAEFFVSLGQTDQAVRILENRISESGETSPLAYLDLLKIFHSLGLKADFRQVREDFNLLFNARVPEFASFANEGRDLEAYPEIVQSLVQAWGKPEILPTIEALVFRDQWTSHHELLDLAVFRDLLLMHAVAQMAATLPDQLQVAAGRNIPRSPFSNAAKPVVQTAASQVQPLSASEPLAADDVPLPPLAGTTEVDIDLTDLALDFDLDPPPTFAAPPPVASNPDPGNLIDFDLPRLPGDEGGTRHGG